MPRDRYTSRGKSNITLNGRVRVAVREPAFREELLPNDLIFENRKIPVTPAGFHVVTVYVRDLPVELSDETVKSAFSSYGEV